MPSSSADFLSVGCNRLTQALAWGIDGLVAFGAHHSVALYEPMCASKHGVKAILKGHTNRVNGVQFINRGHELDQRNVAMISGSADKTARIWKKNSTGKWICSAVLEGHTGSVVTMGVVRARSIQTDKDLIATGSGDGTIKIWERKEVDESKDEVTLLQTINVGRKYAQTIAISYFPNTTIPIMAVGSTDSRISIYVWQAAQFELSLSLQGHDNWVRSLGFASYTKSADHVETQTTTSHHHSLQEGDLLLASGSQDKYIRLWRISAASNSNTQAEATKDVEATDSTLTQDMLKSLEDMSKGGSQLSTKAHIISLTSDKAETLQYSVLFEALLLGHDDWVYTVSWQPPQLLDGKYHQPMALLSSSTDKSMMIWKPDEETGVWINKTRVGEVGGTTIGFYGGLFGPDGQWIMAYGYNGALHIWRNEGNEDVEKWVPQVPTSGHYGSVQDLTWDPTDQYLVSVSLDQTARLFAPWNHTDEKSQEKFSTWHEIARPQIHGYDIQCIAFSSKWTFVSGSDEKVLRVFDAPQTFVHSLSTLTGNQSVLEDSDSRPVGANLPALGLSNKALFEGDISALVEAQHSEEFLNRQSFVSAGATPTSLIQTMQEPPFEEHLMQHTLWPEVDKLFGHGYELMCVDASHDGKWIASACRAHTPDQAVIRLYDAKTWKQTTSPLVSHTLTVTKVKFSNNDRFLLSISRDRLWSIYEKQDGGDEANPYKLVASNKAHARILWDCAWSHDDSMFATASRDKTIKLWSRSESGAWGAIATLKLAEAVTSVDFAPGLVSGKRLLAAGLEDGRIFIFSSQTDTAENSGVWKVELEVDRDTTHTGTVNSLAWRQISVVDGSPKLQLASCGADHSVRLYTIDI